MLCNAVHQDSPTDIWTAQFSDTGHPEKGFLWLPFPTLTYRSMTRSRFCQTISPEPSRAALGGNSVGTNEILGRPWWPLRVALQTKHGAISESYLSHIWVISADEALSSMTLGNPWTPYILVCRVGKLNAEPDSLPTTARFLKWRTIWF